MAIEMLPNVHHDRVVSMRYALARRIFEKCETEGSCHGVLMVSVSPIRRPKHDRMEEGLFLLIPSFVRLEIARAWRLVSFGF